MKIHENKIITIGGISFFVIIIVTYLGFNNNHEKTKIELINFQQTEFVESKIVSIDETQYQGGKGKYKIIRFEDKSSFFPLLLDESNSSKYNLFKENAVINKKRNSLIISLSSDGEKHSIQLRNPKNEDNRKDSIIRVLSFFGPILIILILIPNSIYRRYKM